MLSNMIDFNKDKSLKILTSPNYKELLKIHDHTGFIGLSQRGDHQKTEYGFSRPDMVGIFLLDSYIYIPRSDTAINTWKNAYILPIGPIRLSPSQRLQASKSGSSLSPTSYFSFLMAQRITAEYRIHRESLKQVNIIEDSQTQLYELFSKEFDKQIIQNQYFNTLNSEVLTRDERNAKNIWLSRRHKNFVRSDFFLMESKINTIRLQVEAFRKSYDYLIDLEFTIQRRVAGTFPHLGLANDFRLSVNQHQLDGINFIPLGSKKGGKVRAGLYNRFENDNVKNFAQLAKDIISKFGTVNKKVLIQPVSSTNDPTLGYQHYLQKVALSDKKYLPSEKTVFEVDLDRPQEAQYILEHIAHIMGTKDTVFVFREWVDIDTVYRDIPDSPYGNPKMEAYFRDHKKMICAVDFDGFLRLEDIYSGLSRRQQVLLDGYSTNSAGKEFFDSEVFSQLTKWDDVWIHKMGFTIFAFNDFYFNEIKNGYSRLAEFLRNEILDPNEDRF